MEEIKHTPEVEKKIKKHPVGETVKPKDFVIGGKRFAFDEFTGVTARTIKDRLAKRGIEVSNAWATAFHARINNIKKEDK